jgi:hypothetical protein
MITIKVDTKGTERMLNDLQKRQIPFATAVALTNTGKAVEKRLRMDMGQTFDRPSPYTMKSTFSTPAKKSDLQATVGLKDKGLRVPPAVLLKEHFSGGTRGNKPFEKALAGIGALPSGWRAIPGAGLPLDRYGNPKRNTLREIIGSLKSRSNIYRGRGKRMQLVGYFMIPVGSRSHLAPGVYIKTGRDIKPVLIFIKSASYRKVLDLPRIAAETVDKEFNREFTKALDRALATAK